MNVQNKPRKVSKHLLLAIISWMLLLLSQVCSAQNVGINSTGAMPNNSTILDLNTGNTFTSPNGKGLLIPNVVLVSTTDAVTITTPATSLLVYNTNAAMTGGGIGYWYNSGTTLAPLWVQFSTSVGGNTWALLGNAGTTAGTNFMGTTDNTDVVFKRNNVQSGLLNNASSNTSWGVNALNPTTTGNLNTAIGVSTLITNTTGRSNTATGVNALQANTTGSFNTATGLQALDANTTGTQNTAHGYNALSGNNIGFGNTATGAFALSGNSTGNNNTAFGYSAGSNITGGSDNIAIGYNAQIPNATNSNQIRIGDALVTYAGVQVAWTITSDRRLKTAIKPANLGLDFITKLKPVSYIRNNDADKKLEYGFIAQEVEETLTAFDATNTGIIAKDDKGMYSVRYNDLLSPIVKALQELNTKLEAENAKLRTENVAIQNGVNALKSEVEKITQRLGMAAKK